MEVVATSKHLAVDVAVALDVAGREHLVVVAKATWAIPGPGERARPLPPQPLVQADDFYGEPGASALRYGTDFARFKPRCDVLFDASAHSPDGEPVKALTAGWRVGPLKKGLRVCGQRHWRRTLGVVTLRAAQPFTRMPLHYGLAFGGSRDYRKGRGKRAQTLCDALPENPVGVGFATKHTLEQIAGAPAPSLEALDDPITSPVGRHKPVAFSAVARHWAPRKHYAGTYDEAWQRDVFPFLPADFDEQFHQCAPEDQQMDYPHGGEPVVLRNLMAGRPDVRFQLPPLDAMRVRVLRTDYSSEVLEAVVDTLYFEPDQNRFSAVWRVATPIRRRLQEFDTIAVGAVDPAWWAAKAAGQGDGGCAGCDDDGLRAEELRT